MKASKKKEKEKTSPSRKEPLSRPNRLPHGLFQFTNGGWEEVLPEGDLPRRRK